MYIFHKIYLQWIYWTLFSIARCSTIFASELPEGLDHLHDAALSSSSSASLPYTNGHHAVGEQSQLANQARHHRSAPELIFWVINASRIRNTTQHDPPSHHSRFSESSQKNISMTNPTLKIENPNELMNVFRICDWTLMASMIGSVLGGSLRMPRED
jgi:hypothetical protein